MKRAAFASLVTWLFFSATAVRADLYDDYINATSKKPFVAFLARSPAAGSATGHAFVGLGVQLNENLTVYERLYGYYPKELSKKAVFGKETGVIDADLKDVAWTVAHRVYVTEEQRAAALRVFEEWRSADPKYNVLGNGGKNCNSLVATVATAVGLKAPANPGSTLPVNYVHALKSQNP